MLLRIKIVVVLSFIGCVLYGQQGGKQFVLPGIIEDADTMAHYQPKPIIIIPQPEFKTEDELWKFRRLVRNLKIVYPYAKLGKKIFTEMQIALDTIPNKRMRKAYIKQKEDELLGRYSEELKALSVTQGQLLIKLVDRELNQTSYEIIKEMRGSLQAFMWQQLAKLFGSDLRSTFDEVGEDKMTERIIIMIENGQI